MYIRLFFFRLILWKKSTLRKWCNVVKILGFLVNTMFKNADMSSSTPLEHLVAFQTSQSEGMYSIFEKKTWKFLITDSFFTLTNKTFQTRSHEDLSWKSTKLIFGLECNLYGRWNKREIKQTMLSSFGN